MLPRQNVSKAKCYQGKMLPRQNVSKEKCYQGKMFPRQNVTKQNVTRQNVAEPIIYTILCAICKPMITAIKKFTITFHRSLSLIFVLIFVYINLKIHNNALIKTQ